MATSAHRLEGSTGSWGEGGAGKNKTNNENDLMGLGAGSRLKFLKAFKSTIESFINSLRAFEGNALGL